MNKPRLIKRGETSAPELTKPATIQKTVSVVKEWLGARREHTKQSAREAFSGLFTPTPESCPEC